jgi:hypothetical protein
MNPSSKHTVNAGRTGLNEDRRETVLPQNAQTARIVAVIRLEEDLIRILLLQAHLARMLPTYTVRNTTGENEEKITLILLR